MSDLPDPLSYIEPPPQPQSVDPLAPEADPAPYDAPAPASFDDQKTGARLAGYSWDEINSHLDGRRSAALAAGYSEREISDYLRLPDPQPLQDRLSASWNMTLAEDPTAYIEPPPNPMSISPLEGMQADRIAAHADLPPPVPQTPEPGERPMQSSFSLYDAQMRGNYADALLAGEVQSPSDFAERYAGAFWGAAAGQGVPLDDSMEASIIRASGELANSLPTNQEFTDAAIAIAHAGGLKLDPETVGMVKQNVVDAWADTGTPPLTWLSVVGAAPELMASMLAPPERAPFTNNIVDAVVNVARAAYEGNRAVWSAPPTETTQILQRLFRVESGAIDQIDNPVGRFLARAVNGPIAALPSVAAGGIEGTMRLVFGVGAGMLAGASQILSEAMLPLTVPSGHYAGRYEPLTPKESGEAGAGILDTVMASIIHMQVSGGLPGLRGTPTRVRDAGGNLVPLTATPESLNAAAAAAVKPVFDSAQAILDAPVRVVDPLKPAGEAVRVMPAKEAYAPASELHAIAQEIAAIPEADRAGVSHETIVARAAENSPEGSPLRELVDRAKEEPGAEPTVAATEAAKQLVDTEKAAREVAGGYDAASAIYAHFHNLMVDQSGGGLNWFRTVQQTMDAAVYAGGRDAAQAVIRQYRGHADRFIAANAAKLDEFRKTVNQHMPEYESLIRQVKKLGPGNGQLLDGNPIHEMLRYIEGRSVGAKMDESSALFAVADMLRTVSMNMRAQIEAIVPDMRSFYEDHYRHLWKDPREADKVFGLGKNPQGSGKSLLPRSIPTISDGIEMGLIPKFLNPLDNTVHYLSGMAYHLAARQILADSISSAYVKFADVPYGWKQLNGIGATRLFVSEARKQLRDAEFAARQALEDVLARGGDDTAARAAWAAASEAAKPVAMMQRAYAQPGFARSYNYWVGRGFYGMDGAAPWYQKLQYFANAMTGYLLAFPGYHLTAITQEVAVNAVATGLGALTRGQIGRGLYGIGMGATIVPEAVRQTIRGRDFYKRWLDMGDNSEAMNLFVDAGGRMGPRQEIYRFGQARSLFKSLAEGSLGQELMHDIRDVAPQWHGEIGPDALQVALIGPRLVRLAATEVGRALNTFTDPMFDRMIPAVKGAVTFDAIESWLKANPLAAREEKLRMVRRIINSVDDRLGEMNQANLFWPTTLKQALNLVTVSLGWEYGSLRAAGIAGNRGDTGPAGDRSSRITTDRLRWLIALPMINGIMGAVYQQLMTGTLPQSFLETQFPAIGNGLHARVPGYADKDIAQWARIAAVFGKDGYIKGLQEGAAWALQHGNPMKATLEDFLRGKDPIGHDISAMPRQALHWPFNTEAVFGLGKDQPAWLIPREWAQYASNALGHIESIFSQQMANAKANSPLGAVSRLMGFSEAPQWVEDALSGGNKYWGGRDSRDAGAARGEAQRYNRENEQRMYPGEPAPVPAAPARPSRGTERAPSVAPEQRPSNPFYPSPAVPRTPRAAPQGNPFYPRNDRAPPRRYNPTNPGGF